MRSEIVNIIKEIVDEMSGFSRVRNMMQGGVASVDSIGILTAENPYGQEATTQDNSIKMRQLKSQINSMGLGFIKIGGSYEMKENSLLVPNISKEQVIEMGLKYEQESVIFGEKKESQEGYYFEWSYIQGEKTIQNRKISFSGMGIQDRNDFYSLVKSRKFIIPFFDDKHISSKQKEYPKNQKDKVKSKQDSI